VRELGRWPRPSLASAGAGHLVRWRVVGLHEAIDSGSLRTRWQQTQDRAPLRSVQRRRAAAGAVLRAEQSAPRGARLSPGVHVRVRSVVGAGTFRAVCGTVRCDGAAKPFRHPAVGTRSGNAAAAVFVGMRAGARTKSRQVIDSFYWCMWAR